MVDPGDAAPQQPPLPPAVAPGFSAVAPQLGMPGAWSQAPAEGGAPPSVDPQSFEQRVRAMKMAIAERQMQLLEKQGPALEADMLAKRARAQAGIGQGAALDAANRRAANEPLPPKYDPNYKDINTTPPRFHASDPMNAVAQPVALIAALGGLFARRAGTATIRAMTGAMDGLREGDQQKYENSLKEFDAQLKATQQYNEAEHRKYADAWDNRNKTLNERQALLQMLSTQYANRAMASAVASGSAELIEAQLKMMEGAQKSLDSMLKPTAPHGTQMDAMKADAVKKLEAEGVPPDEAIRRVEAKMGPEDRMALEDKKQAGRGALEDKKQAGREKLSEEAWAKKIEMAEKRGEDAKEIERMREDSRKDLQQQRHEQRLTEAHDKLQQSGLLGGARKPSATVMARALELKKEHPDWTDSALIVQADRDQRENEGKTGYGSLTPAVQMQVENGWGPEATKELRERTFKMLAPERRKLENSAETVIFGEKVANFVAQNPRAMGLVAQMYNTLRIEQLVQGKLRSASTYGSDTPEDAAYAKSVAAEATANMESGVLKMIGQPVGRSGEVVNQSDATNAITLFKLLTQLALSDAAALSTNGQGGTVYLDRRFTDVYAQTTSPEAMFNLIANRQEDVNVLWKDKLGLDWHKRRDQGERPFFAGSAEDLGGITRGNPMYFERARFNMYSDRSGPKLQSDLAKDPQATEEVKQALMLRDAVPTKPKLQEYLQQETAKFEAGTISKKQLDLTKEAVRILLQYVHGVK